MISKLRHSIDEFWCLFQKHAAEFSTAVDSADHPLYGLLLEALQQIHPDLYLEYSISTEPSELILTADGKRTLFPLVEQIVSSAPPVPDWRIIPLKPKIGFPTHTRWQGITIRIADVVFEPLEREGSEDLGLCLYISDLRPEDREDAHNAILQAIDHGLGEREFAEAVQYTEALPLPENASMDDFIPLLDLEKFITWRNGRFSKQSSR